MNDFIECEGMDGGKVVVPREKITHRPSVYGLITHEGKVLLTVTKSTGKYWPPGGGVDIGERLEDALKREVREECGIDVEVTEPLFFREKFFYYAPLDEASQTYLMFFAGTPKSFGVSRNDLLDESIDPQWVNINSLKASDFQGFGEDIVECLKGISIKT